MDMNTYSSVTSLLIWYARFLRCVIYWISHILIIQRISFEFCKGLKKLHSIPVNLFESCKGLKKLHSIPVNSFESCKGLKKLYRILWISFESRKGFFKPSPFCSINLPTFLFSLFNVFPCCEVCCASSASLFPTGASKSLSCFIWFSLNPSIPCHKVMKIMNNAELKSASKPPSMVGD